MKELIRLLVHRIDRNIHPKRVAPIIKYVQSILFTIWLIVISVSIGVIGFMVIEKYNFLDALYMTTITISTVGYGELRPLSPLGRLFAVFLILTNIGVFTYSVGNLANILLKGEYRKIIKDLIIGRKIDKMKNHIIVCGYGRYGKSVVEHIKNQGLECVLIETNHEKIEKLRKKLPKLVVLEGDATSDDTLKEAGVDHAKALITTLPLDSDNVYTILSTRQLNPTIKIISRVNEASSRKNLMKAGADEVIIPENLGGFFMSAMVTKPDIVQAFTEMSSMDGGSFRMAEAILDDLPQELIGKTIADLNFEKTAGVKVIGVKTQDEPFTVNPPISLPLKDKMRLLVIGDEQQIRAFHKLTKSFKVIQ